MNLHKYNAKDVRMNIGTLANVQHATTSIPSAEKK